MIPINSEEEYLYAINRGYYPLIDPLFDLPIAFRVEMQKKTFGETSRGNTPKANEVFYHWMWAHSKHICEETMRPLHNYSAGVISHILTKGAHPEMAHDPRNVNILWLPCHNEWEFGKREKMNIYKRNLITINQLQLEYSLLR